MGELKTRGARRTAPSQRALEELGKLCSTNERQAEAAERELAGKIDPRVFDVSDREAVDPLVEGVSNKYERIDILVNNAGITRDGLMMSMDDDQFDEVLTTNLRAAFWLTRAVSRLMVSRRYGRIVNVGSVSGEFA